MGDKGEIGVVVALPEFLYDGITGDVDGNGYPSDYSVGVYILNTGQIYTYTTYNYGYSPPQTWATPVSPSISGKFQARYVFVSETTSGSVGGITAWHTIDQPSELIASYLPYDPYYFPYPPHNSGSFLIEIRDVATLTLRSSQQYYF